MNVMDKKRIRTAGFSLVEIMIVVGIIGMLSAIALPSFAKARKQSRISRMINDLRIVYDAFNMYAMEHGDYPSGTAHGTSTPQPIADYLSGTKWTEPTVLGGGWWYIDYNAYDSVSATYTRVNLIIVDNFNFGGVGKPLAPVPYWQEIDTKIDDGNLSTGAFKVASGIQMQYNATGVKW